MLASESNTRAGCPFSMHWIVASLFSAFFLGWYELSGKHAVRENAVLPVLFFTNLCSAVVWLVAPEGE